MGISVLPPALAYYAPINKQSSNPHADVYVPDKRAVHKLRKILEYYARFKPSQPFEYGSSTGYQKYPEHQHPEKPAKVKDLNSFNDLPLFEKL